MRCFRFAIDRGGTFTDIYAEKDEYDDQGKIKQVQCKVVKLLSEDPSNYPDAPRYVRFKTQSNNFSLFLSKAKEFVVFWKR